MRASLRKLEELESPLREKAAACQAVLRGLGRVVIGFSGGADSTFLVALAAGTLGRENVLAAIGVSPSLPQRERLAAAALAAELGVEVMEVVTAEMDDPNYAENPEDRCFHCKTDLFGRLKEIAERRGFAAVLSGANADDAGDFRPGLSAGEKIGVRNPLMEAGLTKADIRRASKVLGLATWDKPSMACLASRIPYGSRITPERLRRIEQAEYALNDLGFRQCRVRDHETVARIEVPAEAIERAAALRDKIVEAIRKLGYHYVTLDLQGFRSGSMNEPIAKGRADGKGNAG